MISIVILARNKAAYTRACLESVLQTRPADYELIVVDNGSTDATPEALQAAARAGAAQGRRVRILNPGRNLGCSTARNVDPPGGAVFFSGKRCPADVDCADAKTSLCRTSSALERTACYLADSQ